MSAWKLLLAFPAVFYGLAAGAVSQEEKEISDVMVRQLVGFCTIALEEMDSTKWGICYAKSPNEHNQTPCYPLAYLYQTSHPLNPYYRKKEIRDAAIAICDRIVESRSDLEWPLYNLSQTYSLLKDELTPEKRRSWRDYADGYVRSRGIKPFFYTSFNHEAWSALAILRAGQVFGNPEWEEQGRRLMHQLVKIQTGLGYFDEGPHHGPSMKYNQVQFAPMLLFADYAEDTLVLASAKKLADFMIRYSFPDGSPIGTFDGRQSWSLGYFGTLCYGMDRWPLGKEHNRRIFRTRKKWGLLDPNNRYYNLSDWYAYFGGGFILDEYLSLRPEAPSSPLPQDKNGYIMVEEGPTFSGGVIRQHDWMVALSAIYSDIPRQAQSVYRLERQSRLDVWHPETGLIIGGGHNLTNDPVPLANFVLLTGYDGVDCDFGKISGGDSLSRRATYMPRSLKTDITLQEQCLQEVYGQGDVFFRVQPLDQNRLKIKFEYDVFSVKKLFVQLPLIVFYNSEVLLDGVPYDREGPCQSVKNRVLISNPTSGSKVGISLPRGLRAVLRPSVPPLRWYGGSYGEQRYVPYYDISLLSVEIDRPGGKGSGEFILDLVK